MDRYGRAIYWLESAPGQTTPPLVGDHRVDVAIVGGGYTGLWTAYELLSADPTMTIVLLEAEEIAFGASGRNGGFAMTLLDMSLAHLLRNQGAEAARTAHQAVARSVDAIGDVCRRHVRGLEQTFRRTFPQLDTVRFSHRWGGPVGISVPFLPLFGTLPGGRVHYGLAYNGHGVAPSHTGGCILADLVTGRQRGYTDLVFVRGKQPRFPSRPLTWLGAALSRSALRRQDRKMDAGRAGGDMDPWLLRLMR